MMARSSTSGLLVLGAAALLSACGGSKNAGNDCHYESWLGKCRLMGVRTTRIIERFPQSFVVVEAAYEPLSTERGPTPPTFSRSATALADHEQALTAHFEQYPQVECAVDDPAGQPCSPHMHVALPEFLPPTASAAPVATEGCARIERSGIAPPPPEVGKMPGPFQFAADSAGESPDILQIADLAAQAIRKDRRIECVAIKAKTAPGEAFTLANERAQLVRKLLETRGVEHARLTVFEATAPTRTAAPDADQPSPDEERRVHLTIVVYGAPPK